MSAAVGDTGIGLFLVTRAARTCVGVGVVRLTVGRLRVCPSRTASFDILIVITVVVAVIFTVDNSQRRRLLLLLLLRVMLAVDQQLRLAFAVQHSTFCSHTDTPSRGCRADLIDVYKMMHGFMMFGVLLILTVMGKRYR